MLIAIMAVWGAIIGIRLYFLHVVQSAELRDRANRQQQRTLEVSPRRGVIYDRNNNELAISIKVDSVFAVPDEIKDPVRTAKVLSELTGIPKAELIQRFDTDKSFTWIKRKINAAEANAIQRARLNGIYFQKEDQRLFLVFFIVSLGPPPWDDGKHHSIWMTIEPDRNGSSKDWLIPFKNVEKRGAQFQLQFRAN